MGARPASIVGFTVHEGTYEIRLASGMEGFEGTFADIAYADERTVVRALNPGERAYGGRRYRMVTFLGDLPLDLVGFLASVSSALAQMQVPIFVISSYRADHLLLLEEDLDKGIEALESIGLERQA